MSVSISIGINVVYQNRNGERKKKVLQKRARCSSYSNVLSSIKRTAEECRAKVNDITAKMVFEDSHLSHISIFVDMK